MLTGLRTKKTFKSWFSCLVLFVAVAAAFGQHHRANQWAFPNLNGLDFSTSPPTLFLDSLQGIDGTSSICDENGDFIFYSNGSTVWQANGAVMSGGSGLVGDPDATQSSIIVPAVLSTTRYYLFVNDGNTGPNGLQYYDVEMTLNSGNGGVVGPTALMDTATEKLCATRHGDDRGYWVVAHSWDSDEFQAFLVDENGVNQTPVTSAVGIAHLNSSGSGEERGQMKISPDGAWLATCNFSSGYVQLFRFNNETGEVSDPITLASGVSNFPYGVEFTADSKKVFYARRVSSGSNPASIYQFDLDHTSEDCLLASEESVTNGNPFKLYADLQLGTDKRIYIGYEKPFPFSADTLGILHDPEKMCPECDYEDNSLLLNNIMKGGLTNFVSSFLSDGIRYEFGSNCEDDTTVFWPEDTLGLDSVRWNFGDPSTGAMNTSTFIPAGHVFSNAPDTFTVTLFSYRGVDIDTFQRNVILWDTAVDLIGPDTTLCTGQSITLDASWYNACLIWDDSSTNTTLTTNQEGWRWVDVYHQSCVWRDSVFVTLVTQPPQFTLGNDTNVCADVNFVIDPDLQNAFYTWQDGSHDTTFAVSGTGTYWLQASNACGSTTDTLNVILNEAAQPVLEFPEDTTGCDTLGITLDVTFEDAVYLWNDGETIPVRTLFEPGIYWVEVGNSCDTVRDTIEIELVAPILAQLVERDVVCMDDPSNELELLATADSQSVVWSDGSIGPTLILQNQPGIYWFEQSNACGLATDTIEVLAYDTSYSFEIGQDTTLCNAFETVLLGDTNNAFPWDYSWSNGLESPTISVNNGEYRLTASLRCDSVYKSVSIGLAPRIVITDSTTKTVCQGDTLPIELSSLDVVDASWSDGIEGTQRTITEPGDYFVTVIDSFGCPHTDSIGLSDLCPGLIFVPNVFTPSGDGINDEFCLELTNIVSFEFSIFNRWGSEVFYSVDETTCWAGQIMGTDAEAGVYYYVLKTEDAMGEIASFRGSFTLIR